MFKERLQGILAALFVTFLWSSSYILVKVGLHQVKILPLTLVTMRYTISSLFLLAIAVKRGINTEIVNKKSLKQLTILGVTGYTMAQGLQCLGLFYLPAVSVTFLLNFTPIFVLILGNIVLDETPSRLQLLGIFLVFIGAYLFFNNQISEPNVLGVTITLVSGIGWASYMVYGRFTLFSERGNLLLRTSFSMSIGTFLLLFVTFFVEGISSVPSKGWLIILWLGFVNTSAAFLLWNFALVRLKAFETAIIQNTMLVQIALLSWIFLGERLVSIQLLAIVFVLFGVIIVQLKQ